MSIIEFILTRNPDSNRFNVEDSISRQFKLKASIAIYQFDNREYLDEISTNLKEIYSLRSTVAHGGFIDKEQHDKFVDSIYSLYNYIRAIMSMYIKDSEFIDYLKDN